jgi:hypothetical protein
LCKNWCHEENGQKISVLLVSLVSWTGAATSTFVALVDSDRVIKPLLKQRGGSGYRALKHEADLRDLRLVAGARSSFGEDAGPHWIDP